LHKKRVIDHFKKICEKEEHILTENTEIRIFPKVFHRMEMLEDTIFIEFHTEVSDYTDVVKMEL